MNLKCITCGKDAEFMVKGDSLCREHLPHEIKRNLQEKEDTERLKKHNMH